MRGILAGKMVGGDVDGHLVDVPQGFNRLARDVGRQDDIIQPDEG